MILADKIMNLRKKCGWSQEELAQQLGISRQSVSKWEAGVSIPDLEKVIKLSTLFGVSTDYLLKDEIGDELPAATADLGEAGVHMVSLEEANTYMDLVKELAPKFASAVSALIVSPVCLLILAELSASHPEWISEDVSSGVGISILLAIVIAAVIPLIVNTMRLSKYEYLEKGEIDLLYGVKGIVEKRKDEQEECYRKGIAVGVALCIAGVIPLILGSSFGANDMVQILLVCLLLCMISAAVNLFIRQGLIHESFTKLLQEGDYTSKAKQSNELLEKIAGVYWCLITAAFLFWSFVADAWTTSWVIWPVAGVLFAAIACGVKFIKK